MSEIDANVELLNVCKVMEPQEVVNGKGDGPYAVRAVLGGLLMYH